MSDVWRIFVIESEEALNRSLVNSLRKDGYVVQGVTNGADAVRVLWSDEYDVVLCDLKAPGTDGFELLHWLRLYHPNTRMVVMGTPDLVTLRVQALESGAVSYIEKPLDFRVVKEELRRLLQPTGFSASLDSFDLLDVIQIINMSRKSIALLVNTGLEERGTLRFQNGELVWAEYGILRGEEAFFALAAHKNGTVIQQPWNEQVVANVTQPLSRLIFQALQYRSKYADRLQYSGEMDVIHTTTRATDEVDDTPFIMFEEQPGLTPEEPVLDGQLATASTEAMSPATTNSVKEWWEQTGRIPRVSPETTAGAATPDSGTLAAPPQPFSEFLHPSVASANPASPAYTVQTSPQVNLPSWLTDQPTASTLPVVRPPASTPSAQVPATPVFNRSSPEWQVPVTIDKTAEQATGLSSALPIAPVDRGASSGSAGPRRSSPEWQVPTPNGRTVGQATGASSGSAAASAPMDIQSLSPARGASGALSMTDKLDSSAQLPTVTQNVQRAARRNYAALVSALQTLGYSISGFIAAAVVTIDGQPVAQVAVDDLDISQLCKPFSVVQRHILQALEQSQWGDYEHTIISSGASHVLLRAIGNERKAFQVLVTTRDANPMESLEVMANVEGAISAALRP